MTPKIAVSVGDLNGIGLEVVLKTFDDPGMLRRGTPVLYGHTKAITFHQKAAGKSKLRWNHIPVPEDAEAEQINVFDCWEETVEIEFGKLCADGGKYAGLSLSRAVDDLQAGIMDVLVTAPINKKAMQMSGFSHPGHTEYLQQRAGVKHSLMMMVHENLRVALATNHEPLARVAGRVNRDLVQDKLAIFEKSLKMDFGIEKPIIAVLGLNPHAGDGGALGDEEERHIRPAVLSMKKKGSLVNGPFPADGFFGSGEYRKYDGILAMYHDQGLVPFKTLSFGKGVNFTAGLPFIRTSPDHGTGLDIAGKNQADPSSFREAVWLATDIARHRRIFLNQEEPTAV